MTVACRICGIEMNERTDCGGDCVWCLADAGDPECVKYAAVIPRPNHPAANRQEFEDRNYGLNKYHALYDAVTAQLEHERDGAETEDEEAIVARIYEAVRSVRDA